MERAVGQREGCERDCGNWIPPPSGHLRFRFVNGSTTRPKRPPPGRRPGGVRTSSYFFGFGGKSFSSFAIALSMFFCRFSGLAPASIVLLA